MFWKKDTCAQVSEAVGACLVREMKAHLGQGNGMDKPQRQHWSLGCLLLGYMRQAGQDSVRYPSEGQPRAVPLCLPHENSAQCWLIFIFLRETRNLDIHVKSPDF